MKWCLLFLVLLSNILFAYPLKPDLSKTPSSLCTPNNPDFFEYRYHEKIAYCKRHVSLSLKDHIYKSYGINSHCKGRYTIDHFIPLSIGGDNNLKNLWPEHVLIKAKRRNLEENIYKDLLNGKITQATAIKTIISAKLHPTKNRFSSADPCDQQISKKNFLPIYFNTRE